MLRQLDLQKQVLQRVIRMHVLRSTSETSELLSIPIEDELVFELLYEQLMERLASSTHTSEHMFIFRSPDIDVTVESLTQLMKWLASNRAMIVRELRSIVDTLGGIELVAEARRFESGEQMADLLPVF